MENREGMEKREGRGEEEGQEGREAREARRSEGGEERDAKAAKGSDEGGKGEREAREEERHIFADLCHALDHGHVLTKAELTFLRGLAVKRPCMALNSALRQVALPGCCLAIFTLALTLTLTSQLLP